MSAVGQEVEEWIGMRWMTLLNPEQPYVREQKSWNGPQWKLWVVQEITHDVLLCYGGLKKLRPAPQKPPWLAGWLAGFPGLVAEPVLEY